MGAFLASPCEFVRRKVWEQENLPIAIMELLDIVMRLGDAIELGHHINPDAKHPFEKSFGRRKNKFPTKKGRAKEDAENGLGSKAQGL